MTAVNAAGWSPAINRLLRGELGFTGVTITDSLTGTAHARGRPVSALAAGAARAGTDMILLTGSEASTRATFDLAPRQGAPRDDLDGHLQASYARIVAHEGGHLGQNACSVRAMRC